MALNDINERSQLKGRQHCTNTLECKITQARCWLGNLMQIIFSVTIFTNLPVISQYKSFNDLQRIVNDEIIYLEFLREIKVVFFCMQSSHKTHNKKIWCCIKICCYLSLNNCLWHHRRIVLTVI